MHFTRRNILLAGTVAAVTPAIKPAESLAATDLAPRIRQARDVVKGMMAAEPLPALSVAVANRQGVLWAEAFGKANIELGVAATPAHRFRLGSVSKVFTATLAAMLAADGRVDLDAPITRYMSDLPAPHRSTTLRQLLTHRGGIRHYIDRDFAIDAPGGPIDQRIYGNSRDILAVFIDDPLIAAPGERLVYSTFSYTLASLVLEAATRTDFLELLEREVFDPLRLVSAGPDDPRSIVPGRVNGYLPRDSAANAAPTSVAPTTESPWINARVDNPAYKWAGGGLLATPSDVARFGAAHLASGVISSKALDTLFSVQVPATEGAAPLGLGWRILPDERGRPRWHHAGGLAAARAVLVVYPQQGLSIAFAANTAAPRDVLTPSSKIADAFTNG